MKKTKGTTDASIGMPEKRLPTLYLEGEDVLDGADVGDKVTLTVKAKVVAVSERNRTNDEGEQEQQKTMDIEILGMEKTTDDPKAALARKVQRKGW
jgi:hypothetical protein